MTTDLGWAARFGHVPGRPPELGCSYPQRSSSHPTRLAKALRLLAENRIRIDANDPRSGHVRASIRVSSGGVYRFGWDGAGRSSCSCPAFRKCSHVVALELLFDRQAPEAKAA